MLISTITASTEVGTASVLEMISMNVAPGLPEYGILAVITLILLLSAKEVLSASERWNKSLGCSLNASIAPLLLIFAAIVLFKISEILIV